jgi:flagellar basal-body rod modification protein FlgD
MASVTSATTPTANSSNSLDSALTDTTSSSGQAGGGLQDLDINQFLKLMVTELTNQDPLNPMDNTQLVEQLGQLRSIAASDQLTSTLKTLGTGQSLTTASSLIGKTVSALTTDNQNITGTVDSVTVDVDANDSTKRTYTLHVNGQSVDLDNVREVD